MKVRKTRNSFLDIVDSDHDSSKDTFDDLVNQTIDVSSDPYVLEQDDIVEALKLYKKSKEEKDTVQVKFSKAYSKGDMYRFHNEFFYRWTDNCYWGKVSDREMQKMADKYLEGQSCKNKIDQCLLILSLRIGNLDLNPKNKNYLKKYTIIPTREMYTKIDKKGNISAIKPNKDFCFNYSIDAKYDDQKDRTKAHKGKYFLNTVSNILKDDDTRKVMQEFFGYTFTSNMNLQTMVFLTGDGSNGKTSMIELVTHFHNNHKVVKPDNLSGNALAGAENSTLIIANETEKRIDAQSLKSIVSEDLMPIKYLYKNEINARIKGKVIFACNNFPFDGDGSHGYWRRMITIPFNSRFDPSDSNYDPDIVNKIVSNDSDNMFTWAVDGLVRLIKNGNKFSISEEINNHKKNLKSETNSAVNFIDSWYIAEVDDFDTCKDDIYNDYREFCMDSGFKPFSNTKFWKTFDEIALSYGIKKLTKQKRVADDYGKKSRKYYTNIKLYLSKEEYEADVESTNMLFGLK